MTGRPFMTRILGADSAIVTEAAFGADLTDVDGSGWTWTDITADVQHNPGVPITLGRADNISQAGAAAMPFTLKNAAGDYTPTAGATPFDQNTPVRQRQTLDGATYVIRHQGYLDTANPTYDTSGKIRKLSCRSLGMLGRLGGRTKPLRSALVRFVLAGGLAQSFWPLDDAAGSTRAVSALGGPYMQVTRTPATFGVAGPAGTGGAVDLHAGSTLVVSVPGAGSISLASSWRVEVWANFPTTLASGQDFIEVTLTGTVETVRITGNSTRLEFAYITAVGSENDFAGATAVNDGQWHRITLDGVDTGSGMSLTVSLDGVSQMTTTISTATFGPPVRIRLNPDPSTSDTFPLLSALQVYGSTQPDTSDAGTGFTGETADDRLTRLCAEEGIALDLTGTSNIKMGPQGVDTITNLLRECETADHGLLYDGLGPGLGYQCRRARYNAAAALTLDMAAQEVAPPFAPLFDRQAVKNLYVVTRKGGASATFERVDGPKGTALIGVEDGTATVNIASDSQVVHHAEWLVHLGTVPGFRFASVSINAANIPSKMADLLALKPGDRVTLANPASSAVDLPADDIDVIFEGWAETTTADTYGLVANSSPYAPFVVAVWGTSLWGDPTSIWAL